MNTLEIGSTASLQAVVKAEMTAARFAANDGERFPEVLATPFLIGDLERACAILLEPLIEEGQLSVGASIQVRHVAPTGVGGTYECVATYSGQEGPLYWFDVVATDSVGQIGKGRIARAIVNESEILKRGNSAAPNS